MVFILLPNIIWMICIFYVLYQDKIESDKKILYLLILNLIFMFSDFILGKEFITDTSIEVVPLIIEFMQLILIVYWLNKKQLASIFDSSHSKKLNSQINGFQLGFVGFVICLILIGVIYYFLIL